MAVSQSCCDCAWGALWSSPGAFLLSQGSLIHCGYLSALTRCGCGLVVVVVCLVVVVVWLCRAVGRFAGSVAAPGASRVPAARERGRERTLRPPLTQDLSSDLGRSGPRTPAGQQEGRPVAGSSPRLRLGWELEFFLVERRLPGESRVCLSSAVVFVRGFCDDVAVFISKTEWKTNYRINNRWVWLTWEHSM